MYVCMYVCIAVGIQSEGIYRISAPLSKVNSLKEAFDKS